MHRTTGRGKAKHTHCNIQLIEEHPKDIKIDGFECHTHGARPSVKIVQVLTISGTLDSQRRVRLLRTWGSRQTKKITLPSSVFSESTLQTKPQQQERHASKSYLRRIALGAVGALGVGAWLASMAVGPAWVGRGLVVEVC